MSEMSSQCSTRLGGSGGGGFWAEAGCAAKATAETHTMNAAAAAEKRRLPLGTVEAGWRSAAVLGPQGRAGRRAAWWTTPALRVLFRVICLNGIRLLPNSPRGISKIVPSHLL